MSEYLRVEKFLSKVLALALIMLSLTLTAAPKLLSSAQAGSVTTTYTYKGYYETFTVPAGVTSLTWTVTGAAGGGSGGGKGYKVVATSTVTPGTNYFIYVGSQGYANTDTRSAYNAFGGGGKLTNRVFSSASGGGASDIRIGGNALSNRVIVAGGGGGGIGSGGGNAGYASGDDGLPTGIGGRGATQSAGGAGGAAGSGYSNPGLSGSLGLGGDEPASDTGSAGGGGYYGGGSGGDSGGSAGGGGGSSYVNATYATYVAGSSGLAASLDNGSVQISYSIQTTAAISVSFDTVSLGTYGTVSRLKATTDSDGKVTFTQNGKRIGKCIKVATSGGVAYCNWKPSNRGSALIQATVYPTDPFTYSATSAVFSVVIKGRNNNR